MVCEPFLFWGENREMPLKCREMRENAPKFAGVVAGVKFCEIARGTKERGPKMGHPGKFTFAGVTDWANALRQPLP